MLLAHTSGAAGPNIEVLLLGGAMFVLGVIFFFQKTVKPVVSVVLIAMAIAAFVGAFALRGGDDHSAAPVSRVGAGVI
ncbi:MAG: hypothetical protein ACR2KQ_11145 [Actinomycetota bacterium]